MHQYLPLYSEVVKLPSTTGYDNAFLLKECYYAKRNGKHLKMPTLECIIKHEIGLISSSINNSEFGIVKSSVNNSFNEDAIHKLGEQDTLLIQEYNIELVLQ